MKNKNSIRIALGTIGLLLIPLLAKWPWTMSDFVIMGILIFSTGLAVDWVIRKKGKYWVAVAVGIVMLFLLIWAELAVGLFGTPFAGS